MLVAVTTLSFDIAVLELLLPLLAGATVVLATREQAVDGEALRALLERSRATVMQATPATWRLLIDAGWRGSPALQGAGRRREPAARTWPGSCSARSRRTLEPVRPDRDHGLVHLLEGAAAGADHRRSAGPIANTTHPRARRAGQAVARPACPGEIYIGGDGVAPRLPAPARTDRRALRPRPVRRRPAGAHVPHRRPRALAPRRPARAPGAARLPGQGARPSHRAGRDRGASAGASRGRAVPGHRARRPPRRRAPGGLRRPARRRRSTRRRLRDHLRVRLPDYMLPPALRRARRPAAAAQRQDRPASRCPRRGSISGRTSGGDAPSHAGGAALAGIWRELLEVDGDADHAHRQLLRPRRRLAAGQPGRRRLPPRQRRPAGSPAR